MPWLDDGDARLYLGDVRDVLDQLDPASVQTCVTSPPYWGLRDYGTATWAGGDRSCAHRVGGQVADSKARGAIAAGVRPGIDASTCLDCGATRIDQQIGLEESPDEYVAEMVGVFRGVRRVLRDDGTLWLNLGDSYAGSGPLTTGRNDTDRETPGGRGGSFRGGARTAFRPGIVPGEGGGQGGARNRDGVGRVAGLKPKDLVGIPWRVAFALQADGWYLRSAIVWAKPNPMPESVTDRPTSAYEFVFLFSKAARYFYDADAIREEWESGRDDMRAKGVRTGSAYLGSSISNHEHESASGERVNGDSPTGRNARNVWTIATQPYPEAHFATFPEELPRRCIAAGTSEAGACSACGAARERVVERTPMIVDRGPKATDKIAAGLRTQSGGTMTQAPTSTTTGWAPTCTCNAATRPCTVLDPFAGSGTTLHVARKLGRRSIGIELNADYAALASRRLAQGSLLA